MNLVVYTSLPKVGGHTTVTLKLVEMVRERFDQIWIGVKEIPGHGISNDAIEKLQSVGCAVQQLGGHNWGATLHAATRWMMHIPSGEETVFVCIGMRYLPPLFSLWFRSRQSIYYHITHDLTEATCRRLDLYRRCFSKLLFVCPSSCHAYAGLRPRAKNLAWITQGNELENFVWQGPGRTPDGVFRFGFSSRLNEAKGSRILLEFAEKSRVPCELHVAGEGEFRRDFERLAANPILPVKVIYHGTFLPSQRTAFLERFFAPLDCVCVPSIDDLEGFPTVILEALQCGVPVLATNSGGTASYALEDCGPANPMLVELVAPAQFAARMEARAQSGNITQDRRMPCREYYDKYFSDAVLARRWSDILDLNQAVSRIVAVSNAKERVSKVGRLLIFSSVPLVGGHTTITLSLVRLLADSFECITVLAKEMPRHGTSQDALTFLQEQGIEVVAIPWGFAGYLQLPLILWQASLFGCWHSPTVFLAMGMRHLSPVLALLLQPTASVYYHITHELTRGTRRMLRSYGQFFGRLAFISPATASAYQGGKESDPLPWVAQPTELDFDGAQVARQPGPIRFAFVARLNEAKGSRVLLAFAESCRERCELNVVGSGEFAPQFARLAARPESASPVRVHYHGSFAPSDRLAFYSKHLPNVDYLIVASQDDREGLPTVILEALQFGVPVVATDCGGTRAFSMPELAPANPALVQLIPKEQVGSTLASLAVQLPPSLETRRGCQDYYREHFSDAILRRRWLSVLGV